MTISKFRRVSGTLCVGAALVFLTTLRCGLAAAQVRPADPNAPSAQQIVTWVDQMNDRRASALEKYVSQRELNLVYKGFPGDRQASETVAMTFTAPASKTFSVLSSSGSSLIRDRVFKEALESEQEASEGSARWDAALTPANYNLKLLGQERLPQGNCFVLAVSAKTKSRFAYDGTVWIDSADFAVVRIVAKPARNPSFWIRDASITSQYQKIGSFWLPERTVSSSRVRLGGDAEFTIDYGPYQILKAFPVRSIALP